MCILVLHVTWGKTSAWFWVKHNGTKRVISLPFSLGSLRFWTSSIIIISSNAARIHILTFLYPSRGIPLLTQSLRAVSFFISIVSTRLQKSHAEVATGPCVVEITSWQNLNGDPFSGKLADHIFPKALVTKARWNTNKDTKFLHTLSKPFHLEVVSLICFWMFICSQGEASILWLSKLTVESKPHHISEWLGQTML